MRKLSLFVLLPFLACGGATVEPKTRLDIPLFDVAAGDETLDAQTDFGRDVLDDDGDRLRLAGEQAKRRGIDPQCGCAGLSRGRRAPDQQGKGQQGQEVSDGSSFHGDKKGRGTLTAPQTGATCAAPVGR